MEKKEIKKELLKGNIVHIYKSNSDYEPTDFMIINDNVCFRNKEISFGTEGKGFDKHPTFTIDTLIDHIENLEKEGFEVSIFESKIKEDKIELVNFKYSGNYNDTTVFDCTFKVNREEVPGEIQRHYHDYAKDENDMYTYSVYCSEKELSDEEIFNIIDDFENKINQVSEDEKWHILIDYIKNIQYQGDFEDYEILRSEDGKTYYELQLDDQDVSKVVNITKFNSIDDLIDDWKDSIIVDYKNYGYITFNDCTKLGIDVKKEDEFKEKSDEEEM